MSTQLTFTDDSLPLVTHTLQFVSESNGLHVVIVQNTGRSGIGTQTALRYVLSKDDANTLLNDLSELIANTGTK